MSACCARNRSTDWAERALLLGPLGAQYVVAAR
jgi:hypothetical protein